MLSETHPIRQLLLAEPDVMPANEFIEKVTRYLCLSLDYRRNTRDGRTWISAVYGAAAPVDATGGAKGA